MRSRNINTEACHWNHSIISRCSALLNSWFTIILCLQSSYSFFYIFCLYPLSKHIICTLDRSCVEDFIPLKAYKWIANRPGPLIHPVFFQLNIKCTCLHSLLSHLFKHIHGDEDRWRSFLSSPDMIWSAHVRLNEYTGKQVWCDYCGQIQYTHFALFVIDMKRLIYCHQ